MPGGAAATTRTRGEMRASVAYTSPASALPVSTSASTWRTSVANDELLLDGFVNSERSQHLLSVFSRGNTTRIAKRHHAHFGPRQIAKGGRGGGAAESRGTMSTSSFCSKSTRVVVEQEFARGKRIHLFRRCRHKHVHWRAPLDLQFQCSGGAEVERDLDVRNGSLEFQGDFRKRILQACGPGYGEL